MKSKIKLSVVLLLTAILLLSFSTIVFGKDVYMPSEFKGQIDTESTGAANVKSTGGKIVGIIRVVGTMVAVAMITILGIKYMMGSAEERAEYKKTLFPYLVGAVFIFAASSLTQVVYSWAISL